ncbi:Gfo/Idh/MocA family protein [Oryzicola mucosus]|uniref:Gfo/Idh/MocA family oxidoreductase n=1 Tax=Oryzicola mucosus TaxID=2767425 RepID=A0A8J6Q585_9HYPH|nr:Gfo/Idh/MocA family oxidoreductase [Oryzicola mucosus]MBD0417185.1 Gfo/Idh/MocA family oxidoreductase [Oryzicola mucosus]
MRLKRRISPTRAQRAAFPLFGPAPRRDLRPSHGNYVLDGRSMTSGLCWALIGASSIARERMVHAIRSAGGNIVAVQSGSLKRAETFASNFSVPLATTSLEEAAALADAVYISSTNSQHCATTLEALEAGCHVLCEKPIAVELDDARRMIEAADAAGRVLAVNHHLRHNSVHRTIRDFIISGRIGNVRAVTQLSGIAPVGQADRPFLRAMAWHAPCHAMFQGRNLSAAAIGPQDRHLHSSFRTAARPATR